MKLTAKYKNGTLVLDRPIHPKSDIVHIEISDEELCSSITMRSKEVINTVTSFSISR